MTLQRDLYRAADELRSIANLGLYYKNHPGDVERYERIREIAARVASYADGEDATSHLILKAFTDNWMAVSPAAGADAVVVRDGAILLQQRSDTGLWGLPGGLVDVGETTAAAALRELKEEVGMTGTVKRLLGIFDSYHVQTNAKAHFNYLVYEVDSAETPTTSRESIDVGFFHADQLPPLFRGHDKIVPMLFKMLAGELAIPYFDK